MLRVAGSRLRHDKLRELGVSEEACFLAGRKKKINWPGGEGD